MDKQTHDELEMQELENERKIANALDELVRIAKAWLIPARRKK